METIGQRRRVIAEGRIPEDSTGPEPEMLSHETARILDTADRDAQVTMTALVTDREPPGIFHLTVPGRRAVHQRFDDVRDPEVSLRGVADSSVIERDVPVVVHHTRLDSGQTANAPFTTLAGSG